MRVEITSPMEGPTVSRRPGQVVEVDDDEGDRLVDRGHAYEVDDKGARLTEAQREPLVAKRQAAREKAVSRAQAAAEKAVD